MKLINIMLVLNINTVRFQALWPLCPVRTLEVDSAVGQRGSDLITFSWLEGFLPIICLFYLLYFLTFIVHPCFVVQEPQFLQLRMPLVSDPAAPARALVVMNASLNLCKYFHVQHAIVFECFHSKTIAIAQISKHSLYFITSQRSFDSRNCLCTATKSKSDYVKFSLRLGLHKLFSRPLCIFTDQNKLDSGPNVLKNLLAYSTTQL